MGSDLAPVLERDHDELARVVVRQPDVPWPVPLDHDHRKPASIAIREVAAHGAQRAERIGPQQHVVGEVDPVVPAQAELGGRDECAGDLAADVYVLTLGP
jgi:hypothetical protein